ncbi:MAG: methionine adenosyltransferase [Deltaproteobacteria bacterium CG11_big_fil_rev_8_21_14_0_20_49_13]|nr:MAG: methionine adenosyltransferase [Deltaproteobacteria bacterium CG11_big_fil_rev_8_21_14_0_20_49_13]
MKSTQNYPFTSESITEGHPDKVSDQISDAVLDAILKEDPKGRVACETLCTTGLVLIAGEITTNINVDYQTLARETIREIGYTEAGIGFDADSCSVLTAIHKQSPDIARGVNTGEGLFKEQGAGDQGLMFGYACTDTEELMPMPITLAHNLTLKLAELRKKGTLPFLRPDGKSQVTIRYENGKPAHADTVIISTQHSPDIEYAELRETIINQIIKNVVPANLFDKDTQLFVNPTGRFVVGGPHGDTGLTGRKIIADTYGGMGSHGGGAFSGKDPSKVDRSASYAARYIAKNVVASGVADRCEVQLAYAIGYPDPVSVLVNCHGTAKIDPVKIGAAVREIFPMKPADIINQLKLLRPIYKKTASYGHFGRNDPDFTWERTDKAAALKNLLNI